MRTAIAILCFILGVGPLAYLSWWVAVDMIEFSPSVHFNMVPPLLIYGAPVLVMLCAFTFKKLSANQPPLRVPIWLVRIGLASGILMIAWLFLALPTLNVQFAAYQMVDANNLRKIAIGMQEYHKVHGRLPPVAVRDRDGHALLSWRVLLLPCLGEEQLYEEFHLEEPWDSPHNLKLLEQMPKVFRRPMTHRYRVTDTYYQVFVGKGAVFEENWSASFSDVTDGQHKTLLLGENSVAVPWTKPEDIPFEPDVPLPLVGGGHQRRLQLAFCDGLVRVIGINRRKGLAPSADPLRVLITRDAGDKPDPDLDY